MELLYFDLKQISNDMIFLNVNLTLIIFIVVIIIDYKVSPNPIYL